MSFRMNKSNLIKSKSLGALDLSKDSDSILCNGHFSDYRGDSHSQSDSSLEVCEIFADRSCAFEDHLDSGFVNLETSVTSRTDDTLTALELKIVKLTEILQEQHHLLQALKEEIVILKSLTSKKASQKVKKTEEQQPDSFERACGGGKILLDAIELKEAQIVETDLRNALTQYLKSEDLKDHLSQCFSETFRQVYLPFLERSQRRLLAHVTRTLNNSFHELKENSYFLHKSVHKSSCNLRYAIEKHLVVLENRGPATFFKYLQGNLENILKTELNEWRKILTLQPPPESLSGEKYKEEENSLMSPVLPSQPANPEKSIIAQLMKSAQINKQIQNGEINVAFEEALSSSDLSLVIAVCRSAQPRQVFNPCTLKQPVLLSLIQQLATDMLHDTQLKCRYMEDALINLDLSDKVTRAHLPLIVGEIRKHLSNFLKCYPNHVASRRITLIVMVADNLLNKEILNQFY